MPTLNEFLLNPPTEKYWKTIGFMSLIIGIIVATFIYRGFGRENVFVIASIIGYAYVFGNMYYEYNTNNFTSGNKVLMFKLNELDSIIKEYITYKLTLLQYTAGTAGTTVGGPAGTGTVGVLRNTLTDTYSLKNFHVNGEFIVFFHSIKDVSDYHLDTFFTALRATDELLGIRKEIVEQLPQNTPQLFQRAIDIRKMGMNALHDTIYKLPQGYPHNEMLQRYRQLTYQELAIIKDQYKQFIKNAGGFNSTTPFIEIGKVAGIEPDMEGPLPYYT